ENYGDARTAADGLIPDAEVRRIEVDDAHVDTGAAYVSMPLHRINQLGLKRIKTLRVKTVAGFISFGLYGQVRLTIQGRDCEVRVAESVAEGPVLIGRIPLAMLDFVIDPEGQRLIGNPDHGGEWMIDLYHQEFCA